jgi:hypothetical protein
MEQQASKVQLTFVSMRIITMLIKIKLQALMWCCVWMDGHNNQPIVDTQSIPYFVLPKTYLGGKIKTTKPSLQYHTYYLS